MASFLRRIFKRKKTPPLACAVKLDEATGEPLIDSPDHQHTAACFISFEPLALVELFQSQSCAACPPALPGIHTAVNSPNLVLLSHNVTLFDHLGWKDTHASVAADGRHRAYARAMGKTTLSTPQIVVNGVAEGNSAEVESVVRAGRDRLMQVMQGQGMGFHIVLDANDTELRIDSDRPEGQEFGFDLVVAVYRAGEEVVKPKSGPNKKTKIKQKNVVVGMNKLAVWKGGNLTIELPMSRAQMEAGTEAVAFVQAPQGGPVIAVAKL